MSVFNKYSKYYNLLYKDKNYISETDYIVELIRKNTLNSKTILELGCGTGSHALCFAEKGFSVNGVDLSEGMVKSANEKKMESQYSEKLNFELGDVRTYTTNKKFDAIISLFHVISYQVTNNDLKNAFMTAKKNLSPDGVFIFDCWYGPGVLSDPPTVRVKRLEDDEIHVSRFAEPVVHSMENIVDVNYHLIIRDKANHSYEELNETHRMRYLFYPEVEMMLSQVGMKIVSFTKWMEFDQPSLNTWYACFCAKHI